MKNLFLRSFCYFIEIAVVFYETDEDVKAKKLDSIKKDVIPFYLEKLEAIAKENNGYLALGKVKFQMSIKFIIFKN